MKLSILNEDLSLIQSTMSEGRLKRFKSALDDYRRYKEEGEQTATEFKEMKEYLNSGISEAWNQLINQPFIYGGAWEKLPGNLNDVIGNMYPALHTIPGALKKVKKLSDQDHPMTKAAIEFLTSLEEIATDIKGMKGNIVKKKRAAVEKEQTASEANRVMLGDDDVQRVKSALEQITEDLKQELYENNLQWITRLVDRWAEQYDSENDKTDPYEFYAKNNPMGYMILQHVTKREGDWRKTTYVLNDDYEAYLQKEANNITQDMMNKFVYKNTHKLAPILVKKGNLKKVTLRHASTDTGTIEGTLQLDFKDDSTFTVTSKLVWSYSRNGKQFTRYPTTFHNVKLADGTKMAGRASEERMNSEF